MRRIISDGARFRFTPEYLAQQGGPIEAQPQRYGLQASGGAFYTGRGGSGWLGDKAESFTYTHDGAVRKAELLTRITGVAFAVVAV